jgi:hypothetical protein
MATKPKPKPARGRPPTIADLTAALTVKLSPADLEQLTEIAAGLGLTYGGRGAPGPLTRRLVAAYLHDPEVRKRVDAYRS